LSGSIQASYSLSGEYQGDSVEAALFLPLILDPYSVQSLLVLFLPDNHISETSPIHLVDYLPEHSLDKQ
jgi:hypothetical protein